MDWSLKQHQGFQQCSKQLETLLWALRGVCNDVLLPTYGLISEAPCRTAVMSPQNWWQTHGIFRTIWCPVFFFLNSIFIFWMFLRSYLGCQCIWRELWSPRTPKVESNVLRTEKPASLGFSMDPGHTFMWQELYLKHKIILFCSLRSPYRNNAGFQDPFSELLEQSCPTWTLGLPWLWLMYCKSIP